MTMGGDPIAWLCVLSALAATAGAFLAARRGRPGLGLALLVVSVLLLHGNLAWHHWLSDWDERYHAIVARNLVDHPATPRLVDRPFDAVPPEVWTDTDVWLHKPPMALWLIAASLKVFGENEIAVRIPSLFFSVLGVVLTFLLGRRFLGAPAGLLSAALYAWHGRLAQLAAGIRATDHVDYQYVVWVELAAWLAFMATDALVADSRRPRGWLLSASCGLAVGFALLTKSIPALVVIGVFGLALLCAPTSWPVRVAAPALAGIVALLVPLPWQQHVNAAFPEVAAFYAGRNLRYWSETVDGQGGPWWHYLRDLVKTFGALVPVAVAGFLLQWRRRLELLPLVAWLVVPYGVFSFAATKMTAYVYIAAPVVFLAIAWLWNDAWKATSGRLGVNRLAYRALAVGVVLSLVLGSAWRVHRPWRAPARRQIWAEELRWIGQRVAGLGEGPWVVFNVPSVTEARFYTRATPMARMPAPADLARARDLGMRVAIYGEPAPWLTEPSDFTVIGFDPRTLAARAILAQLPALPPNAEVSLWNARDAADLETYLERFVPVDVDAGLPTPRDLERARAAGRPVALLAPGPVGQQRAEGDSWQVIASDVYAAGPISRD